MKGQPRTELTYFRNSNFKHKMKRAQISQTLVYEKFYVHKKILRTRNLSRIYFLKNAKKTCKPNNCDLNRDWINCNSKLIVTPVQKDMLHSINERTCLFLYKNRVAKGVVWDLVQKLSDSSATCQAEIDIELNNKD